MEVSSSASPRMSLDQLQNKGSEETHLQNFELESSDFSDRHNHQFHSMSALEILRETVRILRCNSWSFMTIAAFLICPVSAILLSNVLVDQSIVKRLSVRLLLVAKSSGIPLRPFIKQSSHRFSEMAVSSAMCFPIVYYLVFVIESCCGLFCRLHLLEEKCRRFKVFVHFSAIGFGQELNLYAAMMAGLAFSVVFANAIIICNTAVVVCVLEDVSGLQALLRSRVLIRGQTQVGLLIFLGSAIGMAMIQGLFEHRVKTLSYGDGSSRIWEGPLLVVMHSFVALIDLMMSAVFYYSCRSYSMETSDGECQSILETATVSAESVGTP
ncbi:SON OF SEVENLESS PROTEIN [Salix koriyanagi]|uniref:SON OF SEVENLESS PROTEIN n=1 Tax=Salix koriyanagi TaxID=2511006 RepID=A0A9Q0WSD8_9ROSI|nr:SON OF SEVENLESS PROTEIN [Salix koriyanagi]